MREFSLKKISLGLALISAMCSTTAMSKELAAEVSKSPNFIFIFADDLGWSSLSSKIDNNVPSSKNNYHETPNLDKLAANGMSFTNGYAPAAICSPSRRSIQFGQTVMRQGAVRFADSHSMEQQQLTTIPSVLKSINPEYKTAHYGKWDMRTTISPEDLGYDESDGQMRNGNGDVFLNKKNKWTKLFIKHDPKRIDSITKRAANFIKRKARADQPFYLQLSHYATHVDIQANPETFDKFKKKKHSGTDINAGFAAMLFDMDESIKFLYEKLEEEGIADNTYIIFVTDNGGATSLPPEKDKMAHPSKYKNTSINYPLRGGKWVLYEGGIRVPFIISGPGIKAGTQSDVPVVGYDLLPTIADLAGGDVAKLPNNVDGGSFEQVLKTGQGQVERNEDFLVFHRFSRKYPHSVLRQGDWKLVKGWTNISDLVELYNLKDDLGERHNLAKSNPGKTKELLNKLMTYAAKIDAEGVFSAVDRKDGYRSIK
ncbi:MAG: arylsulfatase A [Psychromonas sp.]|jgi:arylsulfatase A